MSKKSNALRTCSGNPKPPVCPYCAEPTKFYESSAEFYGGRNFGPLYACIPCDARVGCHKDTHMALGWPANRELREARQAVHAAFDPIWKARRYRTGDKHSRSRGYTWLAQELGIEKGECHISHFDVETCQRALEICMPFAENLRRTG